MPGQAQTLVLYRHRVSDTSTVLTCYGLAYTRGAQESGVADKDTQGRHTMDTAPYCKWASALRGMRVMHLPVLMCTNGSRTALAQWHPV